MANYMDIEGLYQRSLHRIGASNEEWRRFLNTSARMNRYPFANQVLIYAQRPEATAVARYEFWNRRMQRPIRRGSKGIAMLNPKNHTVEYGFDITDTIELRRSEPVVTWELQEDMQDDLQVHFSEDYHLAAGNLPEVMEGVVAEHTDDCWKQLKDRILIVADNRGINNSESRLQASFKAFVKASAAQVVGRRAKISIESTDYPGLKQIADSGLLPIYGTAVRMVVRQVCDEIEGYITLIEEERVRKAEYETDTTKPDEEWEADYEAESRFDESGNVRVETPRLPEGGEAVPVQEDGTGRRAAGTSAEVGRGMQGETVVDDGYHREITAGTKEIGYDGVGGVHEHREDGGRAPDIGRDGLHLKEPEIQQNTDEEAEEIQSPAFFVGENADGISKMLAPVALETPYYAKHTMMPMDVIDTFLRMGTDRRNHNTAEILMHFAVEGDINRSEEFLKSKYGTGGKGIEINGTKYAAWYDDMNYVISQGDSAMDWSMNSIRMTWYMVALRIRQLIQAGVYAEQIDIDMAREQVIDIVADSIPLIVRELPDQIRETLPFNGSYYDMTQVLQGQLSKKSNVDLWLGHFNWIWKMEDEGIIEIPAYTIRSTKRVIEQLTMLSRPAVYYEAVTDYKFAEPPMFVTEDEIKEYFITRGSGFADGKYRIYEFMHYDDHTDKEKADFLKNEYGTGGRSHALHGADSSNEDHDAKGIRLSRNWFKDNETEVLLKWNEVARRIDTLIADGEYLDEASILEVERRRNERLQAKEEVIVDIGANIVDVGEVSAEYINVGSDNVPESTDVEKNQQETLSETIPEPEIGEIRKPESDYDEAEVDAVEAADGQLSIFDWNTAKTQVHGVETSDISASESVEELIEEKTQRNAENNPTYDEISENNPDKDTVPTDVRENLSYTQQPDTEQQAEYTNYHIPDHEEPSAGPKERFQRNIAAILALRIIEEENRQATDLEKQVLFHYVGWGGLADAFDKNKKSWQSEREALQEILTPQEYVSARESTLNAHFTDPAIIRGIYDALEAIGFTGGSILEPSMGIGNFIGAMPESFAESRITGIELDGLSGRIAKVLYPEADITIGGFEHTDEHDRYDLAIGNVPFGDYKVNDPKFNKLGFSIHNYFFAKALEQVRPGGVVAFITSSYTMDAKTEKVRQYLAERAELIGAVRLPDDAFKANAGAEVVTDIIFLKKREAPIVILPEWVGLDINADGYTMNSYFVNHQDMILGTLAIHSTAFDSNAMTVRSDGRNLRDAIREAAEKHFEIRYEESRKPVERVSSEEETIPADPNVKNYSYTVVNGELFFRIGSEMKKAQMPEITTQRALAMVVLRDVLQDLINAQVENEEEGEIEHLQTLLNEQYDGFVEKYGRISETANRRAFGDDSSYCLLCSLEEFDEEGNFKQKAAIFSKRTIRPAEVVTHVNTPADALIESVRTKAGIDFAFMNKLLGDGWSYERLTAELQGVIYKNPEFDYDDTNGWETADEYLSGNVRQKLARAKIAAEQDNRFGINVAALEEVQPQPLEATDINVRIGSTWIDKEYYQQFMIETFQPSYYMEDRLQVQYAAPTGRWFITNKSSVGSHDINATETYGTKRVNAYAIFEQSLNLKDARVYDTIRQDGKEVRVLNSKETALAQQKQQVIKNAFADWIWNDLDRRNDLVEKYNEKFNSFALRDFDGSYLQFPGMTADITLRDYQKNAIARTLFGGNTLLAHAVGAGKTNQAIASAMESKRLGLCQKTMIVVPNHLIQQWGADFLRLYPTANILVATKKDFQTANRKKFCARIATGEYDAIIIGHSQFERIPISDERQIAIIQGQINDLVAAIDEVKAERGENFTIKQMEKMKRSLQVRLEKLNNKAKKDDVVTFEQLGVDKLIVDESHFYKNRFFYTKMRNVAGLSTAAAQKSEDMFMKCRYLDEITGGKGIIFMTGTPISNSLVEMYTLMMYLMHDKMVELGLSHFDSWASTFGETVTSIELAPEGTGYRARTRFAKFFNLPELMTLFKDFADIKVQKQLNLNLPEAEYQTIVTKPSAIQQEMVKGLSKRAELVHAKRVDPSVDNMLKITSDGRKVGLDQRLMNDMVPDDPDSKVNTCVEKVFRIWQEGQEDKLTQLLFCDLSTPRNDGDFSVYDDIKQKLVTKGIPEEEIAFIHSANTDNRKAELFANVRAGKVRVLLGSTQKMGAGTNCQDKLIAVHHLDCGWKPSDMEQRNGRIIRFGNQNQKVYIYQYVTEGTFDAYLFQTLEKKADFIGQVMTDKSPARSCEDVDSDALNYAEIKALCAGDDRIREKMSLDVDVTRLQELKSSFVSQKHRLEDQIARYFPMEIAKNSELIAGYEKDIKTAEKNPLPKEGFVGIELFGRTYMDKEKAGEALHAAREKSVLTEPQKIGHYRGFELELSYQILLNEYRLNLRGEVSHEIALGKSASGNFTRMDNALEKMPELKLKCEQKLESVKQQLESAKVEIERPFEQETELQEKLARLAELNAQLNIDGSGDNGTSDEEAIENEEITSIEDDYAEGDIVYEDLQEHGDDAYSIEGIEENDIETAPFLEPHTKSYTERLAEILAKDKASEPHMQIAERPVFVM